VVAVVIVNWAVAVVRVLLVVLVLVLRVVVLVVLVVLVLVLVLVVLVLLQLVRAAVRAERGPAPVLPTGAGAGAIAPRARGDRVTPGLPAGHAARRVARALPRVPRVLFVPLTVLLLVLLTDRIHASGNRLVPLVCPVDGCPLSHGS
jgi:hypothetical protein